MKTLCKCIYRLPHLNYLDLTCILILYLDNMVEDEGIKELSRNLQFITELTFLDISGNMIEGDGLIQFSQNLKYIPNITSLNLSCIYK